MPSENSPPIGVRPIPWVSLVIAMLWIQSMGCHRSYYREDADCQAYELINQKTCYPNWPLEGYTIEVDPMSRMYDPFDPDFPPMPPDDPTSHDLMHCVYCMKGYPCWHANGSTNDVDNPNWTGSLPIDEYGRVTLDVPTALHIARLHSTDYQSQLEELYLSALDVSFERFRFDTQYFGGTDIFGAITGRDRNADTIAGPGSGRNSLSTIDVDNSFTASKLFATGAELTVGLANSIIWQISGPRVPNAYNSLIDFTLVQPLLRNGGRDFVLERLTIAERTLLANVRQMERWRRGFYLEVITGRDAGAGPSRRGGVFGGSGLEGFTGTGGGGFGNFGGGGGAGGVAGGAGAAQAGGFLGLLQDQQDLVNQRGNIAALQSSVVQLEAYFLAGRIDFFQVELARQALYNAQSRLLNAEAAYQSSLDSFKRTVGISQQIELAIKDDLIAPFQLVDTAILPLQNRLTALQQSIGRNIIAILGDPENAISVKANGAIFVKTQAGDEAAGDREKDDEATGDAQQDEETDDDGAPELEWNDAVAENLAAVRDKVGQARQICEGVIETNIPRAQKDLATLNQSIPQRRRDMATLKKRFEQRLDVSNSTSTIVMDGDGEQHENPLPLESSRLKKLPSILNGTMKDLRRSLDQMLTDLEELESTIDKLIDEGPELSSEKLFERITSDVVENVPSYLSNLAADVLSLTLVQARARTESVALTPVEIEWQNAVEIARCSRRDWMNSRASLVDSWRLIQFNANQLESDLDITLSGDMGTLGADPLDFRASTGRIRAGLEFDAPLTRLSERNSYRQALIEYQQARRSYYRYVDGVTQGLRNTVRTLEVNQLNFELRRAAVEVAIAQVELARLRLQEPPKPAEDATLGATTARDLVSALSDLLNVQNDFLSVWINHEALRRSIDFDMGTMNLAPDGVWIDPGPIVANTPNETLDSLEMDDTSIDDTMNDGGIEPGVEDGEGFLEAGYTTGPGTIGQTSFQGTQLDGIRPDFGSVTPLTGALPQSPSKLELPRRLPAVVSEAVQFPDDL